VSLAKVGLSWSVEEPLILILLHAVLDSVMMKHLIRAILTGKIYHEDRNDGRGMAWGAAFRHPHIQLPMPLVFLQSFYLCTASSTLTISRCQPITSGQTVW
jgi:hypothetical protein